MDTKTITVDPGDENPAADALNGVYERHRALKPGDKVLDLGAHKGYFSRVAIDKIGPTGEICAFEPYIENFTALCRRCGSFSNIRLICAGAFDCDTTMALWLSIDNSGAHSLFKGEGQHTTPYPCPVVDIGPCLERLKFFPNFVKIDTELSEGRILSSLMKTKMRPEIAAEIHNQQMWDECTALLQANGYKTMPDKFTNYYLYAWQP